MCKASCTDTSTTNNSSRQWQTENSGQHQQRSTCFLHVTGKRSDGYHELQTVFQLLDFSDDLFFDVNETGEIQRRYDYGIPADDDLCLRAARLLNEFADPDVGVTIDLVKRIPIGGGLGGGSSNAATVLLALNELWGVGLCRSKLAELGLQLGADVPVFVHGRSAWAEGIGELLTPVELPETYYLVLNPNIQVSTARIFAHPQLTAMEKINKAHAIAGGNICATFGVNQLEPIARAEHTEIDDLLKWLSQFGEPRMTGSGASVFLPLLNQEYGLDILKNKPPNTQGFVAKGLNVHPLLDHLYKSNKD